MWKIPDMKIGDKVKLLEDVYVKTKGITLQRGEELNVSDVGTRYKLPYITTEKLTHELQLQPRTYEKVT